MKFVDEFRDRELAHGLAAAIRREANPERRYNIMEFCGGHTHAIFRYGVQDLMPENVSFVHGPGCPVCVLPIGRIDNALELAEEHRAILCSYGDMLRVPASKRRSLLKAKAEGADVRMVYSIEDALKIARENPRRETVFFAIGFETTTPPTAVAIRKAQAEGLSNFFVFCNHVLTPAAIQHILESPEVREIGSVSIDAFLGPSHVSSIIGSQPYEFFAEEFQRPVVIAGFEPLDVMQAALMAIRQLNEGRHEVENQYIRVVTREGNRRRKRLSPMCSSCGPPSNGAGSASCPTARCASRKRMRPSTPSGASISTRAGRATPRAANAPPSCAARKSPPTASCSARSARPITPSAPAWCPPRAPARPIGVTAASAS